MWRTRRLGLPVIVLLAAAPLGAAPLSLPPEQVRQRVQGVRGTVLEEGTGRVVGGAFVAVLDEAGQRIAGDLSDRDGRFLIELPHPGTFRLRADRLGFEATERREITVPAGRLVTTELVAPARPIVIEGLEVEGGRRCDLRPEAGHQTSLLWEEARKALEIALWTDDGGSFVYDSESWVRRHDAAGRRLIYERVDQRTHVGRHAFRARPPEELAEFGFVQGSVEEGRSFFAPDAGVLLSDAFLGTHCFQVVEERERRLGLAFRPIDGRDQPEVEGTLWFAEGSARLEGLEYRYLNADHAEGDRFGGEVHFEALPGGAWIVREWEIRMPVLVRRRTASGVWELAIDGVESAGGRVVGVRDLVTPGKVGGESARSERRGGVRGTVTDSTTGRPLEGAVVFISGTNWSARTDGLGDFELTEVPEGAHTLLVDHPRLAELGIHSPTARVEVRPGAVAAARVELPSMRGLASEACLRVGGSAPAADGAAVGGIVRTADRGAGRPDAPGEGVRVAVSWVDIERVGADLASTERRVEVVPDRSGWWGVCAVPADVTVRVELTGQATASDPVIVGRIAAGDARWLVLETAR